MQNASDRYVPKPNFGVRKFWIWLILGPVNPISWALIFYFERSPNLFGVTAFATFWPCGLGAAIGLWRLKRRHIHSSYLAGFVSTWAFLTIPVYTFAVACLGSVYFSVLDAGKLEIAHLQIMLLGFAYGLFMLPFAFIFGVMPAIAAAILSYWMIRWFLFDG